MKIEALCPEILPVMVGTAGHVDHGKTALVAHLTGCNTDTLPEEQARGISIDLGFAPCRLPGGRVAGLVDVPGHEDFIRNMVAGAACMDVVLLVIAADDGIMPQTWEHMKILKLLRTPRVFAVVTKIDLVGAERRAQVGAEVGGFLARLGFPDATVLFASNKTGEGLEAVRAELRANIEAVQRAPDERAFRMNVARVFSVKGYGTVATGVPVSGWAAIGDAVELLPAGKPATVRALQSYKFEAQSVRAGACAALALRNLEVGEVSRGMTVAQPGVYRPTTTALAWAENVSDARTMKRRFEARLHSGTGTVPVKARLLAGDEWKPGAEAWLHLELAEPLVLAAGDRFVLRALSPADTLGGGVVLSAAAAGTRRTEPGLMERLRGARQALFEGGRLESELLAGPRAALGRAEALRLTQLPPAAAEAALAAVEKAGRLVNLGGGFLVRARLPEAREQIKKALAREHAEHQHSWGLDPVRAGKLLGLDAGCFPKLAEALGAGGEIVVSHGCLALAGRAPALSAEQMQLREAVLARLRAAGVNAPARGDLARELGAAEPDLRLVLRLLGEEGAVTVLGSNLMLRSVVEDCRSRLLGLFEGAAVVELPAFRKATGLSRNLAVAMLEHFDGERLTRRVEKGRALRVRPKT